MHRATVHSAAAGIALALVAAASPGSPPDAAAELTARYRLVGRELAGSPFGRPLVLASSEQDGRVSGEVLAVISQPLEALRRELAAPAAWCEVLILHLNVKTCATRPPGTIDLTLGRKDAAPDEDSAAISFRFRVQASEPGWFRAELAAADGPVGTRDYSLVLEAVPVERGQRSFLRLSYSYVYGSGARMAMSTYLGTIGRDKVGFTVTGKNPDGSPRYVGGLRGVLERNVMRYYLGVETYLSSLVQPAASRRAWRVQHWFDASERYARQLHELSRDEYVAGKAAVD